MRKFLLLGAGLLLVLVMVGCGAGNSPSSLQDPAAMSNAGPDGAVAPAVALDGKFFAQWVSVVGKVNGVETALTSVFGWGGKNYDYMVVKFRSDGTVTETDYLNGVVDRTQAGLWTASGGAGTLKWGADPVVPFTYAFSGQTVVVSFTQGGEVRQCTFAKFVTISDHNPNMVRVWKLTGLAIDGVNAPPRTMYKDGATAFALQMRASGVARTTLLNHHGVILADAETNNWASGVGIFARGSGAGQRGLYLVQGSTMTLWVRDQGQTRKLIFKPYGAIGEHNASVVGTWKFAGVKRDGVAFSAASYFNWEPNTTHDTVEFLPDGSMIDTQLTATNAISYQSLNGWYTSGSTLHMLTDNPSAPDLAMAITYTATGVKLTETHEGHTYVLTFNKVV
ncbi:MAG TPA: hypothetical protein VGM19_05040 [Armatimonadota bacterium]|jgi:hypothetical protein